jgi:hypothetical protein
MKISNNLSKCKISNKFNRYSNQKIQQEIEINIEI